MMKRISRTQVALERGLPPVLKTFLKVQLLLTLVCGLIELFAYYVLHGSGIYIYPLLQKLENFYDFILFQPAFEHFHTPEFFNAKFPFMYPASVAIVFKLFFLFPFPLTLFLVFLVGSFLFGAIALENELVRQGLGRRSALILLTGSFVLSYPLWFELKQANIEICVGVVVTTGIWAFFKQRGYTAAACFGIAGAMKIFPFVYLGLLLSRKMYRQAAFAVLVAACATIASLWLLGGDIVPTWHHVQDGVEQFRTTYMLQYRESEIGFDHSLFALCKQLFRNMRSPEVLHPALTVYLAIASITGVVLYFIRIRFLPILNQVLCLCIASILLPPVSYDYTLIHLYVPWALLVLVAVETWQAGRKSLSGLTVAFICFAILMSPESEFIRHAVRFGGQIKALTLVVLMYVALKFPFEASNIIATANPHPATPNPPTPAR